MARILFVISTNLNCEIIAGHFLSTISLAKRLEEQGHGVGLAASLEGSLSELEAAQIRLHRVRYPGFFSRPVALVNLVRHRHYEVIISMDVVAAVHAALPALVAGVPLIQVIPGGPTPRFPVIHLPGIVVFSQELYDGIASRHGIPKDYLALSAGRVDFAYFADGHPSADDHDLGFLPDSPRLLLVSRLHFGKHKAIQALLQQTELAAKSRQIQLVVVGDGDARSVLESQASEIVARSDGRARIRFLGGFRITPSDLRQADLVIGQGRTVVEAIAAGVPAAVCGSSGYVGLLTSQLLPVLAETNLTGRRLDMPASLLADLGRLEYHTVHEFDEVRRIAFAYYDVSQGVATIETIVEKSLSETISRSTRCRRSLVGYLKTATGFVAWSLDKTYRELRQLSWPRH